MISEGRSNTWRRTLLGSLTGASDTAGKKATKKAATLWFLPVENNKRQRRGKAVHELDL